MAVQSAGGRVANIPELLEHILLGLPEDNESSLKAEGEEDILGKERRRLLVMQTVSLAFRNTIAESTKTKKRLFLVMPSVAFCGSQDYQFNPLLLRGLHISTPDGPVTFNWTRRDSEARDGCAMLSIKFGLEYEKKVHEAAPDASWRRMYLRKTKYRVRSIKVEPELGPIRFVELTKDNPTAGEIYDAAFPSNCP